VGIARYQVSENDRKLPVPLADINFARRFFEITEVIVQMTQEKRKNANF